MTHAVITLTSEQRLGGQLFWTGRRPGLNLLGPIKNQAQMLHLANVGVSPNSQSILIEFGFES